MAYRSTLKSSEIEQRLKQGYYDDIIEAGIGGGVLDPDSQDISKNFVDRRIAELIYNDESIESSLRIPTIDIGAYPSCSNKGGIHFSTQTVMEQTKDFFTTNFDSIVSKMEDNGYDMAKIHGILSDMQPDHSYFIITKLNFATSWNDASNGVILKIECPADIYTNALYTPNSTSQTLILYCGNYYDSSAQEHTIGNYIIQNSNSIPIYPTYIEIPYSFESNHRTYMEELLRVIQPLLMDFSKFMDNRGTDVMRVDCIMDAVFPDNSYGNGENIMIKRTVIHSSGSGYTYLFTISCHSDTQYNDLKGFGKIHEEGYASFHVYNSFHKYNDISGSDIHFNIVQISDNERIFYPKSITISTTFNDYGGGEDNMDATLPILYIENHGDIVDGYPIKDFIGKDHIINFTPYESMRMYIKIDKAQGCDWIDLIKNEDTVFRMDTGTTNQSPYYDFQEEDDGLNFIIKYSSNLVCP